jgi:hypothetical protein
MEYLTAQNSYRLREWHFDEHMQKTIIRYVTGISEDRSFFQKKLHKRYNGNLTYVIKNIAFDIKHGITNDQILAFLDKIKNDLSYAETE